MLDAESKDKRDRKPIDLYTNIEHFGKVTTPETVVKSGDEFNDV